MLSEREQQISPVVPESIIHNTKILSQLHNLTASLFGIGAGILGLESYPGFVFYVFFTLLTSLLFYVLRVAPQQAKYGVVRTGAGAEGIPEVISGTGPGGVGHFFQGALGFWASGLVDGASGFVLTWTLAYGLVRA